MTMAKERRERAELCRLLGLLGVAALAAGCGSEDAMLPDSPDEPVVCGPGFVGDGESCTPVGMTAEACPEGFTFAADLCLPDVVTDCPPGSMALPGEPGCRPVAPCAEGTWGDIAIGADTQHVDGSYAGADADGSASRPWPTIAQGIAAAAAGVTVAIARGSYAENLTVGGKPVTLWGVCPSEVHVSGDANQAILFRTGAGGSVLRSLAVSGSGIGVLVSGADVSVEEAWVHDTGDTGVAAEDTLGPATVAIRDSLIESFGGDGVQMLSAGSVVERTVIRAPAATARGVGLWFQAGISSGVRATATVTDVVLDRVSFIGVVVSAADVVVQRSAILSPMAATGLGRGWGVLSQAQPETGERGSLVVRQTAIVEAAQLGVSVAGGDALLEHVSVLGGVGGEARGVEGEDSEGARAALIMRDSTVAESDQLGILCGGTDVLLERVQIRNVRPGLDGILGRGVSLQTNPSSYLPSSGAILGSLIRDNLDIGLLIANSTAEVVDSGIFATGPRTADGAFGDGISVVTTDQSVPATASFTSVEVRGNGRAGVAIFGSTASLTGCRLACNRFDLNAEILVTIAPDLLDLGGNLCGCEVATPCAVLSSQLEPPDYP